MQSMYIASRGIKGSVIGTFHRSKEKEKRKVPVKQRLYVPCMYSTCLSCFLGLIIFGGGATLVVLGFVSEYLRSTDVSGLQGILQIDESGNITHTDSIRNNTLQVIRSNVSSVIVVCV